MAGTVVQGPGPNQTACIHFRSATFHLSGSHEGRTACRRETGLGAGKRGVEGILNIMA